MGRIAILPLSCALALVACGGSSSGSKDNSSANPPGNPGTSTQQVVVQRISLTGIAVDPYIANAGICVDLNDNRVCDETEPRGTTGADGSFDLGLWPEELEQVRLLLINRGSWEVPQYGLHEGKPYGMPMSVIARRDFTYQIEVGTQAPAAPDVMLTPATTLEAAYALTTADTLALLNSFSTELGKTFTESDITANPLALYGNVDIASLTDEQMAVFRGYLALYGINRILSSMQSLNAMIADQFALEMQQQGSPANRIAAQMVQAIAQATELNALQSAATAIADGQAQMESEIRAQAGSNADMVLNDVGNFPLLTADVIMSTGVAVIEFELNRAQQWVKDGLNGADATYSGVASDVADALTADFATGEAGDKAVQHSGVLGVKVYALRNKSYFDAVKALTYPVFGNVGSSIYDGIVAASSEIAEGLQCDSSGFFIYLNGENAAASLCTSALPTNITEDIANYYGVDGVLTANNSPVDLNVWQHFPSGSVQVSDDPVAQTCSVSGKVYKENGDVAAGVPLYFTYGAKDQEINLTSAADGSFSFTRIPALKYANDGWPAAEVNGDDHYFFGVIAGKRRPVPAYIEYEANADYFIDCRLVNSGGSDVAKTGIPGEQDELEQPVYQSADVVFYPELRPIVASTELTGTFPTSILSTGFRAEIHSVKRFYAGEASSDSVYGGGWIIDAVEINPHPFTTLNTTTGAFSISELAGGSYKLGPVFLDSQSSRWVECSSDIITVAAGTSVSVAVDFVTAVGGNCFYADDGADYGKSVIITLN